MTEDLPPRRNRLTQFWPQRKAKLMCCARARAALPALGIPELWAVVAAAEGYTDGDVTADQLRAASERAAAAAPPAADEVRHKLAECVRRVARLCDTIPAEAGSRHEVEMYATGIIGWLSLLLGDAALLDSPTMWDVPFDDLEPRPAAFDPGWRTDTAVAIARGMYEARDFAGMPILADALQDAGCDNDEVLAHCRGDAPHFRGCWVVDLVLGKS